MSGLWRPGGLFARARRSVPTLVAIVAVAFAVRFVGAVTLHTGVTQQVILPLALVLPAAAACLLGIAAESPMVPYDALGTGRVTVARAVHVAVLLAVAAAAVALATPALDTGHGPAAAVRNLAGLAGVTLLAATVAPAIYSWLPAVLLLGGATFFAGGGAVDVAWSWLRAPDDELGAAWVAVALLGVGFGLFIPAGDRGAGRAVRRVVGWVARGCPARFSGAPRR